MRLTTAGNGFSNEPDSRVFGILNGVDALGDFTPINANDDSISSSVSGNAGLKSRFDTGFINRSMNLVFNGFSQEDGYA